VSKITPHDLDSITSMFEAGAWQTLELRYGTTELFLSKLPGLTPSWDRASTESGAPPMPPAARAQSLATHAAGRAPAAAEAPPLEVPPGHVLVKAPSLGTFYRAAKPGDPPFVEVGKTVTRETELCLVEVMKLFTTLRAGVGGKIAKILVNDGAMIELGQPLFLIETNA
jgi:acetyl-CoA carboxylase biotin carboxyl carrier protein